MDIPFIEALLAFYHQGIILRAPVEIMKQAETATAVAGAVGGVTISLSVFIMVLQFLGMGTKIMSRVESKQAK